MADEPKNEGAPLKPMHEMFDGLDDEVLEKAKQKLGLDALARIAAALEAIVRLIEAAANFGEQLKADLLRAAVEAAPRITREMVYAAIDARVSEVLGSASAGTQVADAFARHYEATEASVRKESTDVPETADDGVSYTARLKEHARNVKHKACKGAGCKACFMTGLEPAGPRVAKDEGASSESAIETPDLVVEAARRSRAESTSSGPDASAAGAATTKEEYLAALGPKARKHAACAGRGCDACFGTGLGS